MKVTHTPYTRRHFLTYTNPWSNFVSIYTSRVKTSPDLKFVNWRLQWHPHHPFIGHIHDTRIQLTRNLCSHAHKHAHAGKFNILITRMTEYRNSTVVAIMWWVIYVTDRKRSASDDESEPYSKRRYNEGGHRYSEGGHRYEIRFLVQSQVAVRHILCQWHTHQKSRYRKPVPENLYRFSAGVSCESVSIFSGTEIWYGVEQCSTPCRKPWPKWRVLIGRRSPVVLFVYISCVVCCFIAFKSIGGQ